MTRHPALTAASVARDGVSGTGGSCPVAPSDALATSSAQLHAVSTAAALHDQKSAVVRMTGIRRKVPGLAGPPRRITAAEATAQKPSDSTMPAILGRRARRSASEASVTARPSS